jgi:acetyl-CoA C-acetyltransferase
MIADPINLMDSSPICDGAAAIVLSTADIARASAQANPVRVLASAAATDSLALHDRKDPLVLRGAALSAHRAYELAQVRPDDIDAFELHDAFSIMSVLSLEACGFAEEGQGTLLGLDGEIDIDGRIPICTMGGLKARGHPVGATGVYQLVDAVQQLRGEAGTNQVPSAHLALTQNIGGSGATVITHILESIG